MSSETPIPDFKKSSLKFWNTYPAARIGIYNYIMEYSFNNTIVNFKMCFGIPISYLKIAKLKLYYEIPVPDIILVYTIVLWNTHSII